MTQEKNLYFILIKWASEATRLTHQSWWTGTDSKFFDSLISEPGWVDPLNNQPMMGWVGAGQTVHFDNSILYYNKIKRQKINFI